MSRRANPAAREVVLGVGISMKRNFFAGAVAAVAVALAFPAHAAEPSASSVAEAEKAAKTSGACFNAGIYQKGAVIDYDTTVAGDGATPPRRTILTVKGTKTFNGVSAIAIRAEFLDDAGKTVAETESYANIKKGDLLSYGLDSDTVRQTVEPPSRTPIELKEGKSFKQSFTTTNAYPDGRKEKSKRKQTYTFEGTSKLKTAVGKFKVCAFRYKMTDTFAPPATTASSVTNRVDYVAAEGPYRGFVLRTKVMTSFGGQAVNQVIDVTRIRKFAVK